MVVDKEEHKLFLLELFDQVNVPGKHIDFVHEVKQAIVRATVQSATSQEAQHSHSTQDTE